MLLGALALVGLVAGCGGKRSTSDVGSNAPVNVGRESTPTFYRQPAGTLGSPGTLVRVEQANEIAPAGAHAWRIVYTTVDNDGTTVAASSLVVTPMDHRQRHPVLLWAHGTTGIDPRCAPSRLPSPFNAGGMPALQGALKRGWAIVAPDYPGLGVPGHHPFLVSEPTGRSLLDAVAAARTLRTARLGRRTVAWGYSQGGQAVLAAKELAYRRDVALAGVAALAPISDPFVVAQRLRTRRPGALFNAYLVSAYAATYPDVPVTAYITPGTRALVRGALKPCLKHPSDLRSTPRALRGKRPIRQSFSTGPLYQRLTLNVPGSGTTTPAFVAQGLADNLVLPAEQLEFVRSTCVRGQPLDYRTYPDRGHAGLIANDSPLVPDLLEWTAACFAGEPSVLSCPA